MRNGALLELKKKQLKHILKASYPMLIPKLIESKHFKVVLDLGNGAQAVSAPKLCKMLQCETFLVNQNIDGTFPGRGSEPTPQNLSELSKIVIENKANVGIAFDGDGDRSIFCDNNGDILTGDTSRTSTCTTKS